MRTMNARGSLAGNGVPAAILALCLCLAPPDSRAEETVRQYAELCELDIGVEVPGFNCLDGVDIPMVGTEGGTCDAPPHLPNSGCYKHSRLGYLTDPTDLDHAVVFLCRHKEQKSGTSNHWDDIAVIQTNIRTGATCFYQQLGRGSRLNGVVPAPKSGNGEWLPMTEITSDGNACVQCHDNGAYIRTPYIKQVIHLNPALRNWEAERYANNALQRQYWFPGAQFLWTNGKNWNGNVYRVSVGNGPVFQCSGCHVMGMADLVRRDERVGTSRWLAALATGRRETPHLQNAAGPQGDQAFWMRPDLHAPDNESMTKAGRYRDCAVAGHTNDGTACRSELFEGQIAELHRTLIKAFGPPPEGTGRATTGHAETLVGDRRR